MIGSLLRHGPPKALVESAQGQKDSSPAQRQSRIQQYLQDRARDGKPFVMILDHEGKTLANSPRTTENMQKKLSAFDKRFTAEASEESKDECSATLVAHCGMSFIIDPAQELKLRLMDCEIEEQEFWVDNGK